jgi:tripartite-type tricarboxylate transporter receptor subunit TctC
VAPAGISAEVTAQLNREIGRYLNGPEIGPRLLALGLASNGAGTPESTARVIRREQEQWRALGKELNIEPQ